jgi:hypothetical protein
VGNHGGPCPAGRVGLAVAGRRARAGAALIAAVALTMSGCTAPAGEPRSRQSTGSGKTTPSPARPAPEQPAEAVGAAMRRAVAGMAKISQKVEPTFEPGRNSVAQLNPCELPPGFSASPLEGFVDVDSFYVGSLKTAPAVYRVGGVRAEATLTLEVLATRPEVVHWTIQRVRDARCQAGLLQLVPSPVGGVVPYRRTSGGVSIAGNAAVAVTTRLIPDDLKSDGYYPVLGYIHVITSYRGFMIEVGVLCGWPGRPRDGKAVAEDARKRAYALTERMLAELRKGAPA